MTYQPALAGFFAGYWGTEMTAYRVSADESCTAVPWEEAESIPAAPESGVRLRAPRRTVSVSPLAFEPTDLFIVRTKDGRAHPFDPDDHPDPSPDWSRACASEAAFEFWGRRGGVITVQHPDGSITTLTRAWDPGKRGGSKNYQWLQQNRKARRRAA